MFGFYSRAMGSLQDGRDDQGTIQVVQDDLQLICFDVVSEPSSPQAYYLEPHYDQVKLNVTEGNKHLNNFFTKSDKINRALNEILRG